MSFAAVSMEIRLLVILLLPLLGAVGIALADKEANRREGTTLVTAVLLCIAVWSLLPAVAAGERPSVELFSVVSGINIAFTVEPLGMMFACLASLLWIVNSLYSIGYMRGNGEANQTRFYICFAVAIGATMGIALAGNMFTLFIFYEVLTLSTFPLVAHKGTEEARQGGRTYLGLLLGTSIGFQLIAIIWTWYLTGTLDFTLGGILAGAIDPTVLPWLLALYMFGIGKAALMPFHRWLPAAMVAPTPVSALLHAVAVVKAGVFTVLKVVVYIFGLETLTATGAAHWLSWVAAATLLIASIVALTKDNLKARLAYSTISQLAYVVLGASLATAMGVVGGAVQIAMHACGKITLFFCAGAIYVATHKTEISDMGGLGRVMPFTFAAFFIGALSIIGLPPMGGSWSKWLLMVGAADAGQTIMIGVLAVSSLLNVAYLLPLVARGFFGAAPAEAAQAADQHQIAALREAPWLCVIPPCMTAIGCIILFFSADHIFKLILPIVLN